MTSHDITIAGYLAVLLAAVVLEVLAARTQGPIPPLGDLLTRIMRSRTGRRRPGRLGLAGAALLRPVAWRRRRDDAMTTAAAVASPVDFETYGDYRVKAPPRADGAFVRPLYPFQGRVSADGSTGYPAEAGRYHLYISLACPWAHRSAIVRALLGLEDVVSMSVVEPGPGRARLGVPGRSRLLTRSGERLHPAPGGLPGHRAGL